MTRISSSIKPIELCDKMLIAEHREIIRIPNTIKSGKAKVDLSTIPLDFKLGSGHVIFFYNKLKYLHNRYLQLYKECIDRGFDIQDYSNCFLDLPTNLYKDWEETEETRRVVKERINKRLSTMKIIKYYSKNVSFKDMKI